MELRPPDSVRSRPPRVRSSRRSAAAWSGSRRFVLAWSVASLACAGALPFLHADLAHAHLSVLRQGLDTAGALASNEFTGWSMAVGDFNGDGLDDFAMGAPGETLAGNPAGGPFVGAVVITYGSASGLTNVGAQYLTPNIIGGLEGPGMQFGYALAAGDFNGDGFDDLAISAPWDEVGGVVGGRVYFLPGHATGLRPVITYVLEQGHYGTLEEPDDDFGWSLTVGNFNGDACEDLAIGSPGEDLDGGWVFVMLGRAALGAGPPLGGILTPAGLGWGAVAGRRFGESLAAGHLYDDGLDDLAIGAPAEVVDGRAAAGAVYLVKGTPAGLSALDSRRYTAADRDAAEAQARFGDALAVGKLSGGTFRNLAIGEPGRTVLGNAGAGRVLVQPGSYGGLGWSPLSVRELNQNLTGLAPEADDNFGSALATGDFDGLAISGINYDDLVVGVPGEDANAGQVHVFLGTQPGVTAAGLQSLLQTQFGEDSEPEDHFGFALALGKFDPSGLVGLAVGAPWEGTSEEVVYDATRADVEEHQRAGQILAILPGRQPAQPDCHHAAIYDCENELVFSQRPFDHIRVASTTKVMTLLIACERIALPVTDSRHVDLHAEYTIPDWLDKDAGIVTGQSIFIFEEGQVWELEDLMWATLLVSANDAAYAIADLLTGGGHEWEGTNNTVRDFVIEMNQRAGELGMTRTDFANPAGKDWGDGYSCAADMAQLGRAAMQNSLFRSMSISIGARAFYREPGAAEESSILYESGPFAIYGSATSGTGIKTGNTTGAQRCFLGSARGPGTGIVIEAGFGWSAGEGRTIDVANFLQLGLNGCGVPGIVAEDRAAADPGPWASIAERAAADAGPGPLLTMADVPAALDSTRAAALQTDVYEGLGDVQMDVLRQSGEGPAALSMSAGRGSSVSIAPSQTVTFGIAPFQAHAGVRLTNADTALTATLLVAQNRPPSSGPLNLAPLASILIAPWSDPGADYVLSIKNTSNAHALLDVQELGYHFDLTTVGPPGELMLSAVLRRRGDILEDGLLLRTLGQNSTGPSEAYVSVHEVGPVVGVAPPRGLSPPPRDIAFRPPQPNPFTGVTRLPFVLARRGAVSVAVHDLRGGLVRTLDAGERAAGEGEVRWDGRDATREPLAPGVYLARFLLDGVPAGTVKLVHLGH
jgi:D-alanyl-D-alanine carboxypeptidase